MGKKKRKILPTRLNILFLAVFLFFSALVLRLGVVQIVFGETYTNEVNRTENITVNHSVPRGKIYDRNGRIVVDNEPMNAITYTRSERTSQEERIDVARKLAEIIEKETDKVTERDMKDYWILTRPDKADALLQSAKSELSQKELEDLEDADEYQLLLGKIGETQLAEITESEMEVLAIKRELDTGYAFSTQIVKNENVTDKEVALVSSQLDQMKGVDTTTDWNRNYLFEGHLKPVLGQVSTSEQGIPADMVDYYMSRGYNRNDRVGKSYLEYQYEDVLQGEKEKVRLVTDKSGNVLEQEVLSEGSRGKDVVLTVDMELQKQVDDIVEEELRHAKKYASNHLLDRAFAVMMNPQTGEILAMSGKKIEYDDNGKMSILDYNQGVFTTQYEMGSAIKGATVLAGFETGAIKPGEVMYDSPIRLKGTPLKKSYRNMGSVNDLEALKRSSNVYMFKTAMKMAGVNYVPNGTLNVSSSDFSKLRYYFNQFGLGVKTGIDLPNEADGMEGYDLIAGKLLDLSIGQFDTYTTMQMVQYVSTIANDGYRMQPQIVKEIREPNPDGSLSGNILRPFKPVILNRLDMEQEYIERVQEGFRQVYQEKGGTAHYYFSQPPYNQYRVAGKTGTAQSLYYGPKREYWGKMVQNLTLVGYAPDDQPEVAFAVVVPWADDSAYAINKYIGRRILEAYFNLKHGEEQPEKTTAQTE